MAIRNPVLFGFKVSNSFTDAESRSQCLANLGIDIDDLNVIRGISSGNTPLTKTDLQCLSGLDINLTKYLDRLSNDTSLYTSLTSNTAGYKLSTKGNFEAYGPISGGAIRYQFIPNDKGTGLTRDDLKFGDISTSRASAWSSAEGDGGPVTQAISYGASVQVKGSLKIGQSNTFNPGSGKALINVLDVPEPIRFDTEVATDVLKIKINDLDRYIYAMRGIPVIFTTSFKNAAINIDYISDGGKTPIYTVQATDGSERELTSRPFANGVTSFFRYNAPNFRERFIKVYWNPAKINNLTATRLNIFELPRSKFTSLRRIILSVNSLSVMPDWITVNYVYSGTTDLPSTTLNDIRLDGNNLGATDEEELKKFGSKVMERLPRGLNVLIVNGTYFGETSFKTIDESLVILATQSEYNNIVCNPTTKQQYQFNIPTIGADGITPDPNAISNIEGVYYDKQFTDSIYYVYVKTPKVLINGSSSTGAFPSKNYEGEDFLNLCNPTLSQPDRYTDISKFDILDLKTRCPNLTFYQHINSFGRPIYQTTNSKNPQLLKYAYQSGEVTPRVNLKTIRNYDIRNNRFRSLSDIFKNPQNYLGIDETSDLINFYVGGNVSLSESTGSFNFSKFPDIRDVLVNSTALPIPNGLSGNANLVRYFSRDVDLPPNSGQTSTISGYQARIVNGITINESSIDPVTGDGNANGMENHLFSVKYPSTFNNYVFTDCSSLNNIDFYSTEALEGFIPKFVGNDNLTNIELRFTNLEGGRPANNTENNGLSGRRYILWDNTFQDCQNLRNFRINSPILGRDIGIFDPVTQTYSQAALQSGTFSAVPNLDILEIVSRGQYLRGDFFNVDGLTNLRYLISPSSGWGLDVVGGTPIPAFGGKARLFYVQLNNNNFSGSIRLIDCNALATYSVQSNNITGIDSTSFRGLFALRIFNASNNQISGGLPNFSTASPNIQQILLANNQLNEFSSSTLKDCQFIRVLDLSNNAFNSSAIDAILQELLDNYNNNPRGGVTVNLRGNAAPSRIETQTPTSSTSTSTEEITVEQELEPIDTFGPVSLQLKTGIDPGNPNISYVTRILQDGVDITSSVSIDFAANTFSYNAGDTLPNTGTILRFEVDTTTIGSVTTISGGVLLVDRLKANGWIVRTS